jgi:hypothetical protein
MDDRMVDHEASPSLSNGMYCGVRSTAQNTVMRVMRHASYVLIYGIECVIRITHAVILQSWATVVTWRRQIQSEKKYGRLVASFECVGRGGNEARGNQPYAYVYAIL